MKYCTVCKGKYEDSVSFCPIDGEVLEDDPSSIVGTVLDGQYQIESLLGKGGMGAVYLARHILLGDRVAIKILPPEVRTNAMFARCGVRARRPASSTLTRGVHDGGPPPTAQSHGDGVCRGSHGIGTEKPAAQRSGKLRFSNPSSVLNRRTRWGWSSRSETRTS